MSNYPRITPPSRPPPVDVAEIVERMEAIAAGQSSNVLVMFPSPPPPLPPPPCQVDTWTPPDLAHGDTFGGAVIRILALSPISIPVVAWLIGMLVGAG